MTSTAMCVLLSGPAGAGKTTAAGMWASQRDQPTVHISLDDVREMMKGGFADPQLGWTSEAKHQFELARGACARLARHYVGQGIDCIVDDVIFPEWPDANYECWLAELEGLHHVLVVLTATDEQLIARNATRTGRSQLDPESLALVAERMRPWLAREVAVVDSTKISLDDVVCEIDAIVESQRRPREADR